MSHFIQMVHVYRIDAHDLKTAHNTTTQTKSTPQSITTANFSSFTPKLNVTIASFMTIYHEKMMNLSYNIPFYLPNCHANYPPRP